MISKVAIRSKDIEISCEGTEDFIREQLRSLAELALQVSMSAHSAAVQNPGALRDGPRKDAAIDSTEMIVRRLGVDGGPGLLKAAAAYLTFRVGKERFSRADLLEQMRTAAHSFRRSYASNLGKYLDSAVKKGWLMCNNKNQYALSLKEKEALRSHFADR